VSHETTTGRFAAELTDRELLDVIGEVAWAVRPGAPESLSQPQFDAYVDEHRVRYPGVPTARAIYMRLNSGSAGRVTWRSIVRAACGSERSARQTLVAATRAATPVPVSDRNVFFALTVVARRLDARTVSPGEHDDERERTRLVDRRRGGVLARLLPTAAQLAQYAGGWDEALVLAGLDARAQEVRRPPAPESVPVVRALGLYLEHQGSLASRPELRRFAEEADFALADDAERPWAEHVAAFRSAWEQAGRWCPPGYPPHKKRVRYSMAAGAIPGLPPRVRGRWDELDACADAVLTYWGTLPGRREPTQKGYGRWAVGKPYPAPSRFAQHGGFTAVKERARALRRRRGPGRASARSSAA
jgi:hypothetical protein